MKKFSFSLTDELHKELKDTAKAYNTSMSAICREALASHLHRLNDPFEQSIEEVLATTMPPQNEEITSWERLKSQVWDFLNQPDDFLGQDCGFFSEEYIPEIPGFGEDLFGHLDERPRNKFRGSHRTKHFTPIQPRTKFHSRNDATRFLDELWA